MREDLAAGLRFFAGLPAFLRHPLTSAAAHMIVRRRLEHRDADFLALARRTIYDQPSSPYRKLLEWAGCDYGDLERLVAGDGVEGALRRLAGQGVYLTVDEFKGRRPVRRGGRAIAAGPALLRNPGSTFHAPVQSSGSRGTSTPVPLDLAFVREDAVDRLLFLEAEGTIQGSHAVWGVPGSAAMGHVLRFAACGLVMRRWFSQLDPADPGLHPRYRWSARAMSWGGRLAGVRLPRPEHAPLENPLVIASWMRTVRRQGRLPRLMTYASSAARLGQAVWTAGQDLEGARIEISGEPVTPARLAAVRRVGAEASFHYGSSEVGCHIGYGCLGSWQGGDLHLLHDLVAVVQPGADAPGIGLPSDALLFTSLRSTTPFVLLNVSIGDRARLVARSCGCPLDRLGWTTHLQGVESFEKLTAGGMNLLDVDAARILDDELPRRFGGWPGDYQLVEEATGEVDQPVLRLRVHPRLGPLDADAVREAFLAAVERVCDAARVIASVWRSGRLLQVERVPPLPTPAGKILHLHRLSRGGSA